MCENRVGVWTKRGWGEGHPSTGESVSRLSSAIIYLNYYFNLEVIEGNQTIDLSLRRALSQAVEIYGTVASLQPRLSSIRESYCILLNGIDSFPWHCWDCIFLFPKFQLWHPAFHHTSGRLVGMETQKVILFPKCVQMFRAYIKLILCQMAQVILLNVQVAWIKTKNYGWRVQSSSTWIYLKQDEIRGFLLLTFGLMAPENSPSTSRLHLAVVAWHPETWQANRLKTQINESITVVSSFNLSNYLPHVGRDKAKHI